MVNRKSYWLSEIFQKCSLWLTDIEEGEKNLCIESTVVSLPENDKR